MVKQLSEFLSEDFPAARDPLKFLIMCLILKLPFLSRRNIDQKACLWWRRHKFYEISYLTVCRNRLAQMNKINTRHLNSKLI
jgi:hypothetical protein